MIMNYSFNLDYIEKIHNEEISKLKVLLDKTKDKIDLYNIKTWDYYKKNNNIYESIYTTNNHINVSNANPVSRSYFKLIQILYDFNISKDLDYCTCICDGPGGFIKCLHDYSEKIVNIFGITLIDDDINIPYWNIKLLNNSKNIFLKGEDETGNIYNFKNITNFIKNIKKSDLVTSDGGFDYSKSYNDQEKDTYKLLYNEIFLAINIQKEGGNFVIKFFDLFDNRTRILLYILYEQYDEINIFKPTMSRESNSEKYIVCKGFHKNIGLSNLMLNNFEEPNNIDIKIPEEFIFKINNIIKIFINNQISNINSILKNIERKKKLDKNNYIKHSVDWCKKYNIKVQHKFI